MGWLMEFDVLVLVMLINWLSINWHLIVWIQLVAINLTIFTRNRKIIVTVQEPEQVSFKHLFYSNVKM